MSTLSTKTKVRSAMQLAAELTNQQWAALEHFACRRLLKAAVSPKRQRALAQWCARSLLNTALMQFPLGDLGLPGGRRLQPGQCASPAAFMNALRSAINSLISNASSRTEVSALRKKISAQAERLIDASLDAATAEYQAAADGLQKACDLVDEGIQDVNAVQSAIDALGEAADLASKVVV